MPGLTSIVALVTNGWLGGIVLVGALLVSQPSSLNHTNFDNGEQGPWGVFRTPNGTVGGSGMPTVDEFETVDPEQLSNSLKFKVGQVQYDPTSDPEQGGGLVLQITTSSGILSLSAHIAVTYDSLNDRRNLAGGRFQWLVDGSVVSDHDMGPIANGAIRRKHLNGNHQVPAGTHTIRLQITRPFTSHPGQHAPFQYVDDLRIGFSPSP